MKNSSKASGKGKFYSGFFVRQDVFVATFLIVGKIRYLIIDNGREVFLNNK